MRVAQSDYRELTAHQANAARKAQGEQWVRKDRRGQGRPALKERQGRKGHRDLPDPSARTATAPSR